MDHFHALEFINKNYKSYQKNSLIKEKDFDVIYVQGRCKIVFNTDECYHTAIVIPILLITPCQIKMVLNIKSFSHKHALVIL